MPPNDVSQQPASPWKGRRVLITGSGGFLGSHLARLLMEEGATVHGTFRRRPPPAGLVGHSVNLCDAGSWERCVERAAPEIIFHLAAPVDPSRAPEALRRLESGILQATDHVARSCLCRGLRLVAACTCEVYGDHEAPFSESLPPRPVSAYSVLKAAATSWLLTLARQEGLKTTIVRPFLSYGPGQPPGRLVPTAIAHALSNRPLPITSGRQTRELNFVRDTVRGIALAASPTAIGCVLNIGGGPEIGVLELAQHVFALVGADPGLIRPGAEAVRKGEAMRFFGDHSLARELLGHQPRISLNDGLLATIQAARQDPRFKLP